jgi:thymidylate kinase
MKRSARIRTVYFFGSDGTGKTTQAQLLTEELHRNCIKTRRAWIRGRHSFAFAISMILLWLGYKEFIPFEGAPGGKILDPRRLPAKKLWCLLEFVSVVPLILVRIYIPRLLGYYVVAERYVVDSIVYNEYFLGRSFDVYAKILLHMIPNQSLAVHLDASREDVLARRENGILSESFIDYQLREYRYFARALSALSINSSITSIDLVHKLILERCKLSDLNVVKPKSEIKSRTQFLGKFLELN